MWTNGFGEVVGVNPDGRVLTNAAQVRALTPALAGQHLSVRLHGVVTYGLETNTWIAEGKSVTVVSATLLDNTAGIYLEFATNVSGNWRRGDWLEVEGVSDPGKFAPVVKVIKAGKIGVADIPAPQRVTYDDLLTGQMDAQWVEVSGVVRWIKPSTQNQQNGQTFELWLAMGKEQLPVRLSAAQITRVRVDSLVCVRGLVFYQFNKARQALNPVLAMPRGEPVVVLKPAPEEPPMMAIGNLLEFNLENSYAHRIRVLGVVTYASSKEGCWIQNGGRGLHVRVWQTNHLEIGDKVECLGFVGRDEYSPLLEDAVLKKLGGGEPPTPAMLTEPQLALEHDAGLIQIEATILERWVSFDGIILTLVSGQTRFSALLQLPTYEPVLNNNWQPGSRVRLTGICQVVPGEHGTFTGDFTPQSFKILLRSLQDVTVLQPAPWWTPKHIAWLLAVTAGTLLVAVVAVFWISRYRLRQQAMERMKSEAEFAAVWNERNRIAREMHDTLAQGLGAIAMQLEVVKRKLPEEAAARESLEVARSLARTNLTEARNCIWNMRSQVLETGDLATALGDILQNLTEGTETKGELRVRGRVRRLAPMAENDLLRIGQEAITNAAKYAQAGNLQVTLEFEQRQVRLTVVDDGKGFDAGHPPASEGGFGLVGMRERAARLHAEFAVTSEPGEGTIVMLSVPAPG